MDWSQILNEAIKLVATIAIGLISAYVIPWLNAKKSEVKAKAEAEGWNNQLQIIEKFVASAEQLANANGYDCEWKKRYVTSLLENTLNITVDAEIEAYIESAVIMLHKELFPEQA